MTRIVTYHRGEDSVEWPATLGRTTFEQVDEYGVVYRTESRDFIGQTAGLVLGGTQTLPHVGDTIRETVGSEVFVYEVMAPGQEPHYRYSDAYRQALRIHTKYVGVEGT